MFVPCLFVEFLSRSHITILYNPRNVGLVKEKRSWCSRSHREPPVGCLCQSMLVTRISLTRGIIHDIAIATTRCRSLFLLAPRTPTTGGAGARELRPRKPGVAGESLISIRDRIPPSSAFYTPETGSDIACSTPLTPRLRGLVLKAYR
jgi:hypothetical protein